MCKGCDSNESDVFRAAPTAGSPATLGVLEVRWRLLENLAPALHANRASGARNGAAFFSPTDAGGRRGAGRYETLAIRALARGGGGYRSAFCRPRFVAAPRWSRASRGKPGTTISASLASIPKIFRSRELLLFAPAKSSSSKEQAHETHWSVPFSRRRIGRGLLCLAA
jgi:hypothetical protein